MLKVTGVKSLLAQQSWCSLLYFCFCKDVRAAVFHEFQLRIKLVIGCSIGAMKLCVCVLTQFEPKRISKPRPAKMALDERAKYARRRGYS
jgi:hypothetical protein